jgi:hypothetical protein
MQWIHQSGTLFDCSCSLDFVQDREDEKLVLIDDYSLE